MFVNKSVEYDRNTLFQEVWNEPLTKVAKRYDVSYAALRKHCTELEIPVPPVGYWSQVKFGKKVTKPKLPKYDGPEKISIHYYVSTKEKYSNAVCDYLLAIENDQSKEGFLEFITQLSVPKELLKPHKLAKNSSIFNPDRRINSEEKLSLSVSSEQFERAVIFLDTIFKAVEHWGASVIRNSNGEIEVGVEGVKIVILIKEKTRRIEHVKTEAELKAEAKGRYVWFPRYDFLFTGDLIFHIASHQIPRQNWNDTTKKKIESEIGEIIISIFMAAMNEKKLKEERKILEERRRREQEERFRLEQLREREYERISDLVEKANDHNKARLIREFINALQGNAQLAFSNEETDKIENYVEWAKEKADWLDPLTALDDQILGCKHKKWLNSIKY